MLLNIPETGSIWVCHPTFEARSFWAALTQNNFHCLPSNIQSYLKCRVYAVAFWDIRKIIPMVNWMSWSHISTFWLVVAANPSAKMMEWVRQLGWWHSIPNFSWKVMIPSHVPVTDNQLSTFRKIQKTSGFDYKKNLGLSSKYRAVWDGDVVVRSVEFGLILQCNLW